MNDCTSRCEPELIDPFGRHVSYLRVSVTDRCDFRCTYCMAEHMTFLPKRDLLSLEELDRLCSAFVCKGVRKLRITGGEPLVRKNIMWLFRALARHLRSGRLDELTLTTNGSQLPKFADELKDAGVRRVNVSLDTLDAGRFKAITRWGDLAQVMAGLDAAARPASSVSSERSEEHTSELQSLRHLVCRLLLETKNIALLLFGTSDQQCSLPIHWPNRTGCRVWSTRLA